MITIWDYSYTETQTIILTWIRLDHWKSTPSEIRVPGFENLYVTDLCILNRNASLWSNVQLWRGAKATIRMTHGLCPAITAESTQGSSGGQVLQPINHHRFQPVELTKLFIYTKTGSSSYKNFPSTPRLGPHLLNAVTPPTLKCSESLIR